MHICSGVSRTLLVTRMCGCRCAVIVSNDIWAARRDGWIYIRNALSGAIMNRVITDDAMIMCLEHVPNFATNASAVWAGADDGSIQVYNSRKGTRISTLRHHTGHDHT